MSDAKTEALANANAHLNNVGLSAVTMTRAEAEEFIDVIDALRKVAVSNIESVERKRSWLPSARAMVGGTFRARLETLNKLHERIGTAFNLGGY